MPLSVGTQIHRSLVVDMGEGWLNLEKHPLLSLKHNNRSPKTAALLLLAVFLLIATAFSVSALGADTNNILSLKAGRPPLKQAAAIVSGSASQPAGSADSATAGSTSTNSSSINVNLQSSSVNGNGSANLEVNGRQVPVNDPNSIHQTFTSDNGNTTVNINVTNGGGM